MSEIPSNHCDRRHFLATAGGLVTCALGYVFKDKITTAISNRHSRSAESIAREDLARIVEHFSNIADGVRVESFTIQEMPIVLTNKHSNPEEMISVPQTPFICTLEIECSEGQCVHVLTPDIQYPRAVSLKILVKHTNEEDATKNTLEPQNTTPLHVIIPSHRNEHIYRKASVTVHASDAISLLQEINTAKFHFPQTFGLYITDVQTLNAEKFGQLKLALAQLSSCFNRPSDLTILVEESPKAQELRSLFPAHLHTVPASDSLTLTTPPPPPSRE